jgi:hypothetical protein
VNIQYVMKVGGGGSDGGKVYIIVNIQYVMKVE